jgi:hypothetical protein
MQSIYRRTIRPVALVWFGGAFSVAAIAGDNRRGVCRADRYIRFTMAENSGHFGGDLGTVKRWQRGQSVPRYIHFTHVATVPALALDRAAPRLALPHGNFTGAIQCSHDKNDLTALHCVP